MFRLMFMVFGLFLSSLLRPDDPPSDPPQDPPNDPPADPPSEPTAEEIYEQWKKGDLLTKDRNNEIVQDRLARERKNRETEAEKEKQKAAADALKEQEQYKELSETQAETISERDKSIADLQPKAERAEKLEKQLESMIEGQLKAVPEPYQPLLEKLTAEEKVQWLADNSEKLEAKQEKPGGSPPSPRPAGNGGSEEADKAARERHSRQTAGAF